MPHSGKVGDCVVVHAIVIGLANDEKSMTTLYSRWFNVQVEAPIDAFNVGAQPTINQTVVVRMQQIDGGKWLAIAVELLPLIVGCGAIYPSIFVAYLVYLQARWYKSILNTRTFSIMKRHRVLNCHFAIV